MVRSIAPLYVASAKNRVVTSVEGNRASSVRRMELSPEVRAAFDAEIAATFEREKLPSVLGAVVADGEWIHGLAVGQLDLSASPGANTEQPTAADSLSSGSEIGRDAVYRIASMTKSFTAATVLGLRDDGLLRLDDPIAAHIPELAGLRSPTSDSPTITVRHLLTMSGGMATDDKWGDRQLDVDAETLSAWFGLGATFAHPTGTAMEYSNYGYAMLGRLIENVTATPYDRVVTERLLRPLGMTHTAFRQSDLPDGAQVAMPHHRVGGDVVRDDSGLLDHGGFGSMGGLWSTAPDLAKWIHFLSDGFPARDGADDGPLRRASRREMQQVHRAYEPPDVHLHRDGKVRMIEVGYAMGLEIFSHNTVGKVPSHSGGLPGYGSNMRWVLDRGVGVVTFANVTYAFARGLADRLLEVLISHNALPPARAPQTPILNEGVTHLVAQLNNWAESALDELFASNVDPDEAYSRRRAAAEKIVADHGSLSVVSVEPMSATEGDAILVSESGTRFKLEVQMTPTVPSKTQLYRLIQLSETPNGATS
jgi:CubicO group peptidase (beta-lactamase class C family)